MAETPAQQQAHSTDESEGIVVLAFCAAIAVGLVGLGLGVRGSPAQVSKVPALSKPEDLSSARMVSPHTNHFGRKSRPTFLFTNCSVYALVSAIDGATTPARTILL